MFLFLRLLLAHIIADFPLQVDALYKKKVESFSGHIIHGIIVGVCMLILGFPYISNLLFWCFVMFIIITHIIQDTNKILFNKISEKENVWVFLLDQIFHIAFIALIIPLGIGSTAPDITLPAYLSWYLSDTVVVYLSLLLIAGFGCIYMIPLLKNTFLTPSFQNGLVTKADRLYGIVERMSIFVALSSLPISIIITPPAAIILKIVYVSRFSLKETKNESLYPALATTVTGIILTVALWGIFVCCNRLCNS